MTEVLDPLKFAGICWPDIRFYREQQQVIYSVVEDSETFVTAGNKLGKDFVAGFIVIWFFVSRHPCKIVTTSVKDKHLAVLWGEVERLLRISKISLTVEQGGILSVNNDGMRKVLNGKTQKDSYAIKLVASEQSIESFQGHHVTPDPGTPAAYDSVPRNLFVGDEASGLMDDYYKMADTWAKRKLLFGNPWTCANFFYRAVKGDRETGDPGGNMARLDGKPGLLRRVLKIRAVDSPNVRYAEEEIKQGLRPSDKILVPGVLTYGEYLERRAKWDKIKQCVSLDAEFYEGGEVLMYPPEWLNYAEERARALSYELRGVKRQAKSIGVDTGEGSAETVLVATDELGIVSLEARQTPDTSDIPGWLLAFMRRWGVPAEKVFIDRGGGGYELACTLRRTGYNVKTVAFGTPLTPDKKPRGVVHPLKERIVQDEERYVYKNRRAEMYHLLRQRLECRTENGKVVPVAGRGFAISQEYTELRRQLAPVPLWYDDEGRIFLPPKQLRPGDDNPDKITMIKLVGCSPDQSDALVLAVFGMSTRKIVQTAGAT